MSKYFSIWYNEYINNIIYKKPFVNVLNSMVVSNVFPFYINISILGLLKQKKGYTVVFYYIPSLGRSGEMSDNASKFQCYNFYTNSRSQNHKTRMFMYNYRI